MTDLILIEKPQLRRERVRTLVKMATIWIMATTLMWKVQNSPSAQFIQKRFVNRAGIVQNYIH